MITGAKNKVPRGEAATKASELQEYHFPGGLEFEPMTVRAHSREEAEAEWQRTRRPIVKPESKVEGSNENSE